MHYISTLLLLDSLVLVISSPAQSALIDLTPGGYSWKPPLSIKQPFMVEVSTC